MRGPFRCLRGTGFARQTDRLARPARETRAPRSGRFARPAGRTLRLPALHRPADAGLPRVPASHGALVVGTPLPAGRRRPDEQPGSRQERANHYRKIFRSNRCGNKSGVCPLLYWRAEIQRRRRMRHHLRWSDPADRCVCRGAGFGRNRFIRGAAGNPPRVLKTTAAIQARRNARAEAAAGAPSASRIRCTRRRPRRRRPRKRRTR